MQSENKINTKEFVLLIFKRVIGNLLLLFTLFLDAFRGNKNLIKESKSDTTAYKSVVVMAVFCNNQKQYVKIIESLKLFTELRMHVIVVNNGKYVPHSDLYAAIWLQRKNHGRDFGAWKDGLSLLNKTSLSELILINDTCEWHKDSLRKFLQFARDSSCPVVCATQSEQKYQHMQSYILFFKSISFDAIFEFFAKVKNWHFKRTIVHKGEIGLSRYILNQGMAFDAWVTFPKHTVYKMFNVTEVKVPVNTINFFKKEINREFNFQKI